MTKSIEPERRKKVEESKKLENRPAVHLDTLTPMQFFPGVEDNRWIREEAFREGIKRRDGLISDLESIGSAVRPKMVVRIWEIDTELEQLIQFHLDADVTLLPEMKSWEPFAGTLYFGMYKEGEANEIDFNTLLDKPGQDVEPGGASESHEKSRTFEHSEDYASVIINGAEFNLTVPQAEVIRLLHKVYREMGRIGTLSKKHILANVEGVFANRVQEIFRTNRPAYAALIRTINKPRGHYQLNL